MSALKSAFMVIACLCAASVAHAQTPAATDVAAVASARPANKAEWMRAAWASMATHRAAPPTLPETSGTYLVEVFIVVRRDGTVSASRIRNGSGIAALDQHALRLVSLAQLPPTSVDMAEEARLTMPISYDYGPLLWQRKRDARRETFAWQQR